MASAIAALNQQTTIQQLNKPAAASRGLSIKIIKQDKMKKLLVLSLAAVLGFASSAQTERPTAEGMPKHGHHHKGRHEREEMMKQLNLTKEQKAQLKAQHKEMKARREELKKQDNITVKEWRERQKAMRDEQKSKMDAILTPDQRVKMDEMRKKKMEEHMKHDKGPEKPNP